MVLKSPFGDVPLPELPLHVAFFNQLQDVPSDRPILINGVTDERLTRDQFVTAVKRVASGLARLGVTKGDIVVMYSSNSVEFVITFLAISANGAIMAPMNPAYKKDELLQLLRLVEAKWLFTTAELVGHIHAIQSQYSLFKGIVTVGGGVAGCHNFADLLADDGSCFPKDVPFRPKEDTALILFSSGTTGLPKGVELTHYNYVTNIIQRLFDAFNTPDLSADSPPPVLVYLPLFHVYGLNAVLPSALWKRQSTVIIPRFEPRLFLRMIEKYRIPHVSLVPPVAAFLAKSPLVSEYDLSCLRGAHCAAAPLAPEMEPLLQSRLKLDYFHQGYGLTEMTSSISRKPINQRNKPSSIGILLPSVEAKIIDPETGIELGPNKAGELCVRGPNTMKGYFKNKKATDEIIDSEKWLHTGDISYYDNDGYLFIIDRIKELIKYKAYQVAPAELEGLLHDHPAVADVAVVGIPAGDDGEVPRAFVVSRPGHQVTGQDLVNYVNERVTSYKRLRGGVQFVNEIPRNATGKILRRVLRNSSSVVDSPVCSGSSSRPNGRSKL